MSTKDKLDVDAAKILGEPLLVSFYMAPLGTFSKAITYAIFNSVSNNLPLGLVGGMGVGLVEKAADAAIERPLRGKSTIESTSRSPLFKWLYLAITPKYLAIFQVKQGFLRNYLGEMSAAMFIQDLRDLQIDTGIAPHRKAVVTATNGATLTFRTAPMSAKEASRIHEVAVRAAAQATTPPPKG